MSDEVTQRIDLTDQYEDIDDYTISRFFPRENIYYNPRIIDHR